MAGEWDIAIYDRNERLVLIAEVRTRRDVEMEWVRQLWRSLFEDNAVPYTPYFLIAFLDRFYLWTNRKFGALSDTAPDYIIDAQPVLQPYLDGSGVSADRLGHASMQIIVADWFSERMYRKANELSASEQWLIESGLHSAIAGGRFAYQVPA